MSAPDRDYFTILTQLEAALGDISCVSACLCAMRECAEEDKAPMAAGYLGAQLEEHFGQAREAFDELFDRLIRNRREG